ncbi:MAG: DUF3990 domain-containing protein [Synergistaceae bacterium]|jgi:hypothetical protein|nr:DUF3990 domain-containing protein [Synergistaceae bacterium]
MVGLGKLLRKLKYRLLAQSLELGRIRVIFMFYVRRNPFAMADNIITLYHGSIHDFGKIDVTRGRFNKDFGRGFYTSRDVRHAERLALRNKEIEQERYAFRGKNVSVTPLLYTYEFDLRKMDTLNVQEFAKPDREWMQFVVLNRMSKTPRHDFDIVIGATANDNTRVSIQTVLAAAGGRVLSEKAIDALIALIEPSKLPPQIFFGSQRAADLLQFRGRRIIR